MSQLLDLLDTAEVEAKDPVNQVMAKIRLRETQQVRLEEAYRLAKLEVVRIRRELRERRARV